MSVSISTADYTKQIVGRIDGVEFTVTPMSSAQTIEYIELCEELGKAEGERPKEILKRLDEIMFSVFDKPDEARKVLEKVPIEGVFQIYQKIISEK